VFQSSDFFANVVDADRDIDFSNLAPSDFSFVKDLFSGASGLPPGTYSAAQLREMGVKGLSIIEASSGTEFIVVTDNV